MVNCTKTRAHKGSRKHRGSEILLSRTVAKKCVAEKRTFELRPEKSDNPSHGDEGVWGKLRWGPGKDR